MLSGWLVYNREDYAKNSEFAGLIMERGGGFGLDIRLKFAGELQAGEGGMASEALPAFVINRTRDWLLGRGFEQCGRSVFNSPEVSRIGNDKIESHALAARLGLPQVAIHACRNRPEDVARHGLGYPVVLKNPHGHGGSEVFLARDEGELLAFASKLTCDCVLVQRLCGRPGADVRVYVMGGRILTAVRRHSSEDFRANLSLGGCVAPYELNERERGMAERIIDALWLDYAGIDFIFDADGGFLFNEIEDVVGSRSLYQLGLCDAAGLFAEYIGKAMCK